MEEPTKDTITSTHKRTKVLFITAIISVLISFLSTGTFLVATGELKETMRQGRENDATLLMLSRSNSSRLTTIESNDAKRFIVDSIYRSAYNSDREKNNITLKNIQMRLGIIEWRLKIPPTELPSYNKQQYMTPFEVSQFKQNSTETLQ